MRTVALGQASMQQIDVFKEYIKRAKAMGPPPHDDSVWEEVLEHLFGEVPSTMNCNLHKNQNHHQVKIRKIKDSVESKVKEEAGKTTQSNDKEKLPKETSSKMKKKEEGQSKDLESTEKKN